ncbi:YtxH domain-containing protein [Isoptericola sp. NPDC019482]|uniref:YtxH domain-containing protein n=1 Tax=Isoptericola sp. NPDC019482 TaxID=3154688 RepID=UPI0034969096
MKAGPAFVVGAALGYLLGTEKGRQQLDKAKDWATETWKDPRVQAKVSDVTSSVTEFAKEQGGALKDRTAGGSPS